MKANLIVFTKHLNDEDRNLFLAALEKYSGDMSLVYAFKSLFSECFLSQASRIALEEGLFTCVLNFIKGLKTIPSIKIDEAFLYIRNFLGFILVSAEKTKDVQKINSHFESIILKNTCYFTLKPIKIPAYVKLDKGQKVLVDKESIEEQINKGMTFEEYKKPVKSEVKSDP